MLNSSSPEQIWGMLPLAAQELLACSSMGAPRLMRVLRLLTKAWEDRPAPVLDPDAEARYNALVADLAFAAWEQFPFDPYACGILLQVESQQPFLRPETLAMAQQGAELPPSLRSAIQTLNELVARDDSPGVRQELERLRPHIPGNLVLLGYVWGQGLLHGEWEWSLDWLKKEREALPALALHTIRADLTFFHNEWAQCLPLYTDLFTRSNMPSFLIKAGECLLRLGDEEAAIRKWTIAARLRPWDSNLALRLGDLLQGRNKPGQRPKGQGAVLMFSWNHAGDLDNALDALARSQTEGVPVLVLDNGSTDNTQAVLSRWRNIFPLEIIRLPVNVGVPAARNWLLSLSAAAMADWVIFLDDDAMVSPHWLEYFGKALEEYPTAGIVGCRVRDLARPAVTQSVDGHLESTAKADQGFTLGNFHLNLPDFGDFAYMRPCLSVTGCCHLLTRQSLEQGGGFDLRFSPSQFEDLERDLRCAAAGQRIVYNGHLSVIHRKRSGLAAGLSLVQKSNIEGNLLKLRQGMPDNATASARLADQTAMQARLREAWRVLREGAV